MYFSDRIGPRHESMKSHLIRILLKLISEAELIFYEIAHFMYTSLVLVFQKEMKKFLPLACYIMPMQHEYIISKPLPLPGHIRVCQHPRSEGSIFFLYNVINKIVVLKQMLWQCDEMQNKNTICQCKRVTKR